MSMNYPDVNTVIEKYGMIRWRIHHGQILTIQINANRTSLLTVLSAFIYLVLEIDVSLFVAFAI